MSTVTKSKLYLLIIGILLLSNIALLFFCFKGDKNQRGKKDKGVQMAMFLKKEIGFNDSQVQQFETLRNSHKEKMKTQFDEMKNGKQTMLKYLGANGFSDSAINESATKSAEKQKQMELQMLTHFAAVRKICTTEQLPKFDSLIYKIWDRKKK
ncbi:MAG: periplasmic heavy metal sensor [Ferruginibacter sp.]|nr:periplasmic heavy metal sensor [Ferruginibacter sp.]